MKIIRSLRSLMRSAVVLAIVVAPATASASQATFTFAPPCTTGTTPNPVGPTHSEHGFTLTNVGAQQQTNLNFLEWCTTAPNFAGPGMWSSGLNSIAHLTRDNGGIFRIGAIDLAPLTSGDTGPISLTFIGNLFGGGQVFETFNVTPANGRPDFDTFIFDPSFTNLTSVDFAPEGATPHKYQFSNIHLEAEQTVTPEPASMTLLATGLIGVFAVSRRRKKA